MGGLDHEYQAAVDQRFGSRDWRAPGVAGCVLAPRVVRADLAEADFELGQRPRGRLMGQCVQDGQVVRGQLGQVGGAAAAGQAAMQPDRQLVFGRGRRAGKAVGLTQGQQGAYRRVVEAIEQLHEERFSGKQALTQGSESAILCGVWSIRRNATSIKLAPET